MMKKLLFTTLFSLAVTALFSQCAGNENIFSFTFDGKNYEVVKEQKTWVDAAACAVERGGYLVEIGSVEEQNAIYDAITNGAAVPANYTSVPDGGGVAYVWIGATDQDDEGYWYWDGKNNHNGVNFWIGVGNDGNPVNNAYYNWGGKSDGYLNEPDNYATQNYGAIGLEGWPGGSGGLGKASEWNDISGDNQLYYVIEYDSTVSVGQSNVPDFKIFPNPTRGLLTINASRLVNVEIFDNSGKRIICEKSNRFNLNGYPKGVYIARVTTETSVKTNSFILE